MLSHSRVLAPLRATAVLAVMACGPGAFAQTPQPTVAPTGERLDQDALDPRGRGGFEIGSGARAYGMAGAFLARADDATAASWNPAGLSYLRRPELSWVGAWSNFKSNERKATGDDEFVRAKGRTPDFAAFTYPVTAGPVSGAVQLSFQRVFAFGGSRTITTSEAERTVESDGGFDVLAIGGGLRLSHTLRFGATLNRWFNGFEQVIVREPQVGRGRGRLDLLADYDVSGWNANVGAIWTPTGALNLGLVVKTPFTAKVTLARERTDLSSISNSSTHNSFASDDVRIDFPAAVGFGASVRPQSQLTLSADFTRTFWSKGRIRNFFTLASGLEGLPDDQQPRPWETGDFYAELPFPTRAFPPEIGQNDTDQVRVGVEFVILGDEVRFPIRAGYLSDQLPNKGPGGKSPRLDGVTVGAGAVVGPVMLDAAFLYQWANYLEASLSRTSVRNRRVLVSIIYRHGTGGR